MPKFMDYHETMPAMPPEATQQIVDTINGGQANEHGVKVLNGFAGTGGQYYCLTEAPNAEAVLKSHQAMGIPQDAQNVVEVQSMV